MKNGGGFMIVYVVQAIEHPCRGSFSRLGAEKKIAKQIEAVCKTVRDSEIQENKQPEEIKLTLLFLDEEPQTLTSFNQETLLLALRGVFAVQIEVGDFMTKYCIQSIPVDDE